MLTPKRRLDLITRAQDVASTLAKGEVTRSELRPVLNVLFLSTGTWQARLERAQEVLERLPESWVGSRSNSSREKHARVRSALRPLLRDPLPTEEMRFLLGWISRIVHRMDLETREKASRLRQEPARKEPE